MSNDTEMTTLVDKTELRNRFTPQTTEEEKEQPQETQEQETQEQETQEQETQEQEQEQESQESQDSNTEEEKEAADMPSESDVSTPLQKDKYDREFVEANGKRYYSPLVIREDEYGRKYVFVQDEKFYAEYPSWNTPCPVALSFSLIMIINVVNIFSSLAQFYTC